MGDLVEARYEMVRALAQADAAATEEQRAAAYQRLEKAQDDLWGQETDA